MSHHGNNVRLSNRIPDDIAWQNLPLIENDAPYVFMGEINPHFGHFLLESTARLWALLYLKPIATAKYLYLGRVNNQNLFKRSFIRASFESFSLKAEDFIHYQRPCRLKNVFVAAPAFEIRYRAHPLFRQAMRSIGHALVSNSESLNNSNPAPLYLSKAKLTRGISKIINEADIEDCLKAKGVDILYPETLSLSEQIAQINSRHYIMGSVGSALHTLLFCGGNKIISGIVLADKINSNYILIDKLCNNTAYYQDNKTVDIVPIDNSDSGFQRAFYANNPQKVADSLLQVLAL
jgi:capsular polysaccharide biosynthesis protein